MPKRDDNNSLDHTTFLKFRKLYILALVLIAVTIVISQILIQKHLDSQLNDSKIVNIAGRQRMLSQRLIKNVLLLQSSPGKVESEEIIQTYSKDLQTFRETHRLLVGDMFDSTDKRNKNPELSTLFEEIAQDQVKFVNMLAELDLLYRDDERKGREYIEVNWLELRELEKRFLIKMDTIVNTYDEISYQKVAALKRMEYLLLTIALLILLLEVVFLFRPISIYIKNVIRDFIQSENQLKKEVVKTNELYESKEKSLQELQGLNYAIDNTALFANLRADGSILHLSKKFGKLLGIDNDAGELSIDQILLPSDLASMTIRELIDSHRHSIWTGELPVSTPEGRTLWLEMSIVPMNQIRNNKSVLLLCTDITRRIESQEELVKVSEQKIKKEVDLQKAQSSQIVEAQEEERKRIAKDIHDGIGQMLTALKFNLESIDTKDEKSISKRLNELKHNLSDLIKEVRAVTFNLTPPELFDYGIVATLGKMADQLTKLTGRKIYFENKTDFNGRFDSLIETNLYRVVQEAVNNSLKYSQANYILISLSHSKDKLSIVVDDDGKGFDTEEVRLSDKDSGLGLFFMRERISYINGRIFINSEKDKGTRVTINIDL